MSHFYSTLTRHITPPTSSASRDITEYKGRDAFIENKKIKMKQAQSLVEIKNKQNKRLNELVNGNNSDGDLAYSSLLTKDNALDNVFNNEGTGTVHHSGIT